LLSELSTNLLSYHPISIPEINPSTALTNSSGFSKCTLCPAFLITTCFAEEIILQAQNLFEE